jgi:hypothetical protein
VEIVSVEEGHAKRLSEGRADKTLAGSCDSHHHNQRSDHLDVICACRALVFTVGDYRPVGSRAQSDFG